MVKKFIDKYRNMPIVAKAALWFTIATILQKGISFITVPIFTRIMTTEQYGYFSVYLSWVSILTILGGMDFHTCVYINNLAKITDEKEKDELAVSLVNLSFIITGALFIIYLVAKDFWNVFLGLPTTIVVLMFVEVFFIPVVNLWSTKQRYTYNYKKLVSWTIGHVLLNALIGIFLVLLVDTEHQAEARVFSIATVQVIFGLILVFYFMVKAQKVFKVTWWRKALQLHIPLLPHSLSLTVLSSADRVMINSIVGAGATAIYSVAYSASMVINLIKLSITQAMTPWVYECIKNKKYDSLKKNCNLVMLGVMLMTFMFIFFAPELILIIGSKEYYDAIYVIPPVASSVFFTFLYSMFSTVEFYFEKTKEIMYASVGAALLNILLNAIFIKWFGYIAAGYTTLVCYLFLSIAHYFVMKKTVSENIGRIELFDMKFILLMVFFVLISTVVFSFLYSCTVLRYGLIATVIIIGIVKKDSIIGVVKMIRTK